MGFHMGFHKNVPFSPYPKYREVWNTIELFWMNGLLRKYSYFADRK